MERSRRIFWFLVFTIPFILLSAIIIGFVDLYFESTIYIGEYPFPLTYLITALILGIGIPIIIYLLYPSKKRKRSL